jgi:hypothetical protein
MSTYINSIINNRIWRFMKWLPRNWAEAPQNNRKEYLQTKSNRLVLATVQRNRRKINSLQIINQRYRQLTIEDSQLLLPVHTIRTKEVSTITTWGKRTKWIIWIIHTLIHSNSNRWAIISNALLIRLILTLLQQIYNKTASITANSWPNSSRWINIWQPKWAWTYPILDSKSSSSSFYSNSKWIMHFQEEDQIAR